jgi:hypothetical protein
MIKSARLKTVALFIMCLAESALPGEEAHSIKSILVINSYYSGFAWTDSIMKGIRSRIAAGATQIEISSEYLDARRVTDPAKMKIVRSIVLSKISALDPDLIIASDDSALDFIIENRSRLPREIPLVFCGVNKYSDSGSAARGKITGVIEKPSIAETVMAAISLNDRTRRGSS